MWRRQFSWCSTVVCALALGCGGGGGGGGGSSGGQPGGGHQDLKPDPPAHLTATANGSDGVDLAWDAAPRANSYNLYADDKPNVGRDPLKRITNLDGLGVTIQSGKGAKRRVAALLPDAVDAIERWIDRRA